MKKIAATLLIAVMVFSTVIVPSSAINEQRGGVMGFIAGCCFGVRAAAAYNDGKEIHWREWIMRVPYANILFAIWNGVDGANGMTSADYSKKYGSSYY